MRFGVPPEDERNNYFWSPPGRQENLRAVTCPLCIEAWSPRIDAGRTAGQDLQGVTLNCPTQDSNGNPLPLAGRFGNASVGSLVGPGTVNLSLGLAKDFKLSERLKLKFESSFTNLPNHPNFDDPRNNLSEGTFGQVLASREGDAGGNRVGQFALRIEF